ncbi:hypothetical protein ACLBX9_03060 [Methylobacterium sp. A49B]
MSDPIVSTAEAPPGQRTYRAYHLDRDGSVRRAEIIHAETDDEAKVIAATLVNGCGIELWERARFLGSYPPLDAPPAAD